jgi:hypothetical protein
MAPPLYFFPAVTREQLLPDGELNRELLRAADLAETLADVRAGDCSILELSGAGPGGHSGAILCALPTSQKAPVRLGFYPDFQTWSEFRLTTSSLTTDHCPLTTLYVGLDKEHPPTPECLCRKRRIDGYEVALGDGHTWTVPIVRDPRGASRMPSRWTYGPARKATTTLRDEYRAVWETWGPVVDFFFDPGGRTELAMDVQEALDYCLQVLALNYRLGPCEQCLLDLVGPDNWSTVLAASVDLPTFRDVYERVHQQRLQQQKKTASPTPPPGKGASASSTPAGPGETPCDESAASTPGAEGSSKTTAPAPPS